jgi:hypothetical protein
MSRRKGGDKSAPDDKVVVDANKKVGESAQKQKHFSFSPREPQRLMIPPQIILMAMIC